MTRSLLDTDIFSEVLKGVDQVVRQNALSYLKEFSQFTTSTVTILELIKGLHKKNQQDKIEMLRGSFGNLEILLFDLQAAELSGKIFADLEKTGQPIGRADPMIAGIAIVNNLTLVTGNTDHYQRIVNLSYDLRILNWRVAQN